MMTLQMTAVTMSPVWLEPLLRGLPLLGGPSPSSLQEGKHIRPRLIQACHSYRSPSKRSFRVSIYLRNPSCRQIRHAVNNVTAYMPR